MYLLTQTLIQLFWLGTLDSDASYILVRSNFILADNIAARVAFKHCASLINCITKIEGTAIDGVEDLDLFMMMYSLLENSLNSSDTTSNLWFHSKDEATFFNAIA